MTAKAAWADPMDSAGLLRPGRSDGRVRISRAVLTDWLWIIFFVGVASPAYAVGIENSERYFWLAADLAVVAYALNNAERLFEFAKRYALLMTWCGVAILSALWSIAPWVSVYHGVQLLMTVLVGAMLCLTKPLERILRILFFALLISLMASLVLLAVKPALAFDHNGAFRGILNHKNEFGSRMALLLLTSTVLFLHGWRRLTTLAAIGVAVVMLVLSRSGTSLLLTVAWVVPFVLAVSHQKGYRALSASLGLGFILVAVGTAFVIARDIDLISQVLGSVGKESTLTGRTILWSIGADAFMERPILGYGYKGYWENSAASSVVFLRMVIGQELWFFHNNYLEVAVAFGFMGPVLLVVVLLRGLISAIWRYLVDRSFITLWSALYILFVIAFGFAENPLFVNHSIWQLLFTVALAARASPPQWQGISGRQAAQQSGAEPSAASDEARG